MSQSIFIDLFKMTAAKEFVNIETGLTNYVTEFIDVSALPNVRGFRPKDLFDKRALIVSLSHLLFELLVPFCG